MMKTTRNLVYASMFLALGLVLPFFTGQIPAIGSRLLPMHFPVLICGFVCGGPTGLLVGFVTPILRSLLFGMPPLFPTALAMAFELAAYGFFAGWLYQKFPKKIGFIYLSLLLAMLFGRLVWGIVSVILYTGGGTPFSFSLFIAGAFVNAIPGIILLILIVPILVIVLRKAGYLALKQLS